MLYKSDTLTVQIVGVPETYLKIFSLAGGPGLKSEMLKVSFESSQVFSMFLKAPEGKYTITAEGGLLLTINEESGAYEVRWSNMERTGTGKITMVNASAPEKPSVFTLALGKPSIEPIMS